MTTLCYNCRKETGVFEKGYTDIQDMMGVCPRCKSLHVLYEVDEFSRPEPVAKIVSKSNAQFGSPQNKPARKKNR